MVGAQPLHSTCLAGLADQGIEMDVVASEPVRDQAKA